MFRIKLFLPSSSQCRNTSRYTNLNRRNSPASNIKHNGKPLITCRRPEFDLYTGDKRDMSAKFGSIPLCSDGWHHYKSKNDFFIIHPHLSSDEELMKSEHQHDFGEYEFDQNLLLNLRNRLNVDHTTFIQHIAIPHVLANRHTLIAAETGCGKTIAYLLPIIQNLLKFQQNTSNEQPIEFNTPKVLIITPGRELACQIGEVCEELCNNLNIKTKVIIGGHTKKIMKNPPIEEIDVLVASMGALSKLITTGIYKMHQVRHVVLDEADTLLDDSFSEKLKYILKRFPFYKNVNKQNSSEVSTQLILASATMPTNVNESLEEIIDTSTIHEAVSQYLHKVMPHITQKFLRTAKSKRPMELLEIVKKDVDNKRPVIIFSNKHATSDYISILLNESDIDAISLNKMSIEQIRRQQFKKFQSGLVNVLSTTDLASRGLDTTRACHVINWDFPVYIADYIHRCGRIGRFTSMQNCKVTNFITGLHEIDLVKKIEHTVRTKGILPNVDGNVHGAITQKILRKIEREDQMFLNQLKNDVK